MIDIFEMLYKTGNYIHKDEIQRYMVEFTKIHVEAALKAAEQLQASKYYAGETGYLTKKEWEEIYPLNNIK